MKQDEIENLWYGGWEHTLRGIAHNVAPGEQQLWDDMVSEAWLRVLTAEPKAKVDNEDSYYRRVAQFAMIDFLRKERPHGPIISFTKAKQKGLLHCPACYSNNIAWTVYWPSMVRCRACTELFTLEEADPDETSYPTKVVCRTDRPRAEPRPNKAQGKAKQPARRLRSTPRRSR